MTNDQNTVLDDVKGWLRDRGLTKSNLKSYKYWIPYTVAGGKACSVARHGRQGQGTIRGKAPSPAARHDRTQGTVAGVKTWLGQGKVRARHGCRGARLSGGSKACSLPN